MAGTPTNGAGALTTLADAAKTAVDAVAKLAGATPGEDGGKDPASPITNEALEQLRWARKKYDAVVRWILGAFVAIGLIIFGSLPFVQLTNVSLAPVIVGLGAAAFGLGLIIWAASRAFEPEDASLGEIDQTITAMGAWLQATPANPNPTPTGGKKWTLRFRPREKAAYELRKILLAEPSSHIGPGMHTVADLIREIGAIETSIITLKSGPVPTSPLSSDQVAQIEVIRSRPEPTAPDGSTAAVWRAALTADEQATKTQLHTLLNTTFGTSFAGEDGWTGLPALAVTDAEALSPLARSSAVAASRTRFTVRTAGLFAAIVAVPLEDTPSTETTADLAAARLLLQQIEARVDQLPPPVDADGETIVIEPDAAAALEVILKPDLQAHVKAASTVLPEAVALPRSAALQKAEARLKIRGEARDLLLAESGVSQLRGTFRLVRWLLLFGGFLVLFGGSLYAWAVANPPLTGLNTPVVVTLYTDGENIAALPGGCVDVNEKENFTVPARLISASKPSDPDSGDFSVLLLGACQGERADVKQGQGAVFLNVPLSEDADAEEGASESAVDGWVTVTLIADKDPWKKARVECDVAYGSDLVVTGIVSSPDPDGDTGPFEVKIVDKAMCEGDPITVAVAKGEGSYEPLP